jgi:hypothetical protein
MPKSIEVLYVKAGYFFYARNNLLLVMWTPVAGPGLSRLLSNYLSAVIQQPWLASTTVIDKLAETAMYGTPDAFVAATTPTENATRYIIWLFVDAKNMKVCLVFNETTGEAAYATVALPRALFAPATVATGFVDHASASIHLDSVVVLAGRKMCAPLDWLDGLMAVTVQLPTPVRPAKALKPKHYQVYTVQYQPFTRFVVSPRMYMRQRNVGISVPLVRVDEDDEYVPEALPPQPTPERTAVTTIKSRGPAVHPDRLRQMRL